MDGFKTAALGLVAVLALAMPVQAAESPAEELGALFQCAAGMGIYSSHMNTPGDQPTQADKDLLTGLITLEPRFRARVSTLADGLGDETVKQLIEVTKGDVDAKVEPLRGDPLARAKVVDIYRPVLTGCLERARALPAS